MPSCAHVYCRNSTTNFKTKDGRMFSFQFHKFPADAATRQLWLENLQRDGFVPAPRSVICSEHFKRDCFESKSGNNHPQLRPGAVPTLFARRWNTKVMEKEEEDDESSDGECESWSRWHSSKDKNGSMTAGQTDVSKGLQELQELMDEDEDDDGDLSNKIEVVEDDDEDSNDEREELKNDEREKMEDSRKEALEDRTRVTSRSSGVVQPEVPAENCMTQSALDVIRRSDKITLDTVTMDASLSAVKVGNQKMVSLTFQDVLNSLITPQESDSSAGHKESSGSTPTSIKVAGHQNTDNQDASSQSKGWTAVDGKATQQSLITPELLKSLKNRERARTKGKDKKGKGSKKGQKGKMVISIYRKNTMIRVISSKDLPYLCGNCGSAFTHASVLKEHVESKHNYYEPPEINTSEIVSEVVTHREFLKENLKTKDQVKELQKMYPKPESSAVGKGSEPRWFEKVEQSQSPIPMAESEVDDPIGDDASDLDDDQDVAGGEDSPREIPDTKQHKRKKPYKKKSKERCHRCPVVFTTLAQRRQHMTEVHHEFQTREDANNMWKSKTGTPADEIFKCIYCDTYFVSAEDAEGHLNKHCGLDGTKCETCKEGIKLWHEGRNMELEKLHRRYEGLGEQDNDEDEALKETEGVEQKDNEGASMNSKGEPNAEELIRQSLERVKRISNKYYIIAKCFDCNEEFFLRNHLQNHYRMHEKFTCKECGEECKTMTDFQNHLEIVHKVGLCPCLYCPKKFPNMGKLNYHMLGHLGMFRCILCGITLMSKQSLEKHIQAAVNDPDHIRQRVSEDQVTYSSSNPFIVRSEEGAYVQQSTYRRPRLPVAKSIPCKFCDRQFGYAHGLRRHMRSSHPKEEVPMPDGQGFCCEQCGLVLASKPSFRLHLQTHNKSTHPCPKPGCKAVYSSKYSLRYHLKLHNNTTNPIGRRFRCEICCGSFKTQQYLDMHKRIHSGLKPHTCRFCQKSFRNVTHMVYHEKRMHTGQLDHVCEVCGKGFADPSTLKVHLKIHSDDRPFICKYCSKTFQTELYLRAHVRVHTKPFKCSQCDEGFSQQGARRNHLLKVHGINMPMSRSKVRHPTPDEAERSDEGSAKTEEEMELEDIDVSDTLVITTDSGDKEMISKILAGMY